MRKTVSALCCAIAAACALPVLLKLPATVTHSWLYVLAFGLVFWATRLMDGTQADKEGLPQGKPSGEDTTYRNREACGLWTQADKRLRRYALGFGFAFAFFQLAGWRLDAAGTLGGLVPALLLAVASIALAPACGYLFVLLVKGAQSVKPANNDAANGRKVFWGCFALLLIGWLPVFLAYYPGMFNFDAGRQVEQIIHHEVYDGTLLYLHSVLLSAFYTLGEWLGSHNTGIAIYTLLQMGTMAAAMAYAAKYLYQLRKPRWLWLGMTLVGALLPMHGMLVLCTAKDLPFCAALLTLCIRLRALWHKPELWKKPVQWLSVAALAASMCLMRANGVFCLVAVALVWGKGLEKRRALAALAAGLVLFGGISTLLGALYHPPKTGIREWLSIPLSQVARVYGNAIKDGRELPEAEEILQFIPDANRYQRHLADGIKRHTTVGVVTMPQYLRLWGRLFVQYPADFFDAAAYLTKGYWHLDDETHLDIYAERGGHGYLETTAPVGLGVERDSKWPWLMNTLDRLFVANEYRRIPILSTLVEPAFWVWMTCLATLLAGYLRKRGAIMGAAMLIGLFVSMLFGPCAYIRYAYPMAVCALPLLGLAMGKDV